MQLYNFDQLGHRFISSNSGFISSSNFQLKCQALFNTRTLQFDFDNDQKYSK